MGFSASDVVPFTQARANLSELAEQAKAGAEKIITKNGESYVALIDAARLDYYHRLERERIHLEPVVEALLEGRQRRPARTVGREAHAGIEGRQQHLFGQMRQQRRLVGLMREPGQRGRQRVPHEMDDAHTPGQPLRDPRQCTPARVSAFQIGPMRKLCLDRIEMPLHRLRRRCARQALARQVAQMQRLVLDPEASFKNPPERLGKPLRAAATG